MNTNINNLTSAIQRGAANWLKVLLFASFVILLFASTLYAQMTPAPTPALESGGYDFNMGLTAGYRNTTISGTDNPNDFAANRYYEAYNLRSGFNINSFDLFGERKGGEGFFDELYVTANGLNDPFTSGTIRMRAFNSFDFKVDFRQAKYFLNRDDSLLSGLHKFDMTHDFLNASLDIKATEDMTVNLKFNSVSRSGSATTTLSPLIFDGSVANPAYVDNATRDLYWMNVPKNDKTTEFSGGLTFKLPSSTSLSLGGGMRIFEQDFSPTLVNDTSLTFARYVNGVYVPNDYSDIMGWRAPANVITQAGQAAQATTFDPMTYLGYNEHRESRGPFAYLQAVTKPVDALTITADLRFESSTSQPTIYNDLNAIGRTSGTSITFDSVTGQPKNYDASKAPWETTVNGAADKMDYSSLVGNLGLTVKILDDLFFTGVFGMSSFNEEVAAHYNLAVTSDTGTAKTKILPVTGTIAYGDYNKYSIPQTTGDGSFSFTPMLTSTSSLGLKAGVKYLHRKPDITLDSTADALLSREITALTPYFSFNYRPMKELKLDGRVSQTSNTSKDNGTAVDMPIRTSPEKILAYSGGAAYSPMDQLHLSVRYGVTNGTSTFDPVNIPYVPTYDKTGKIITGISTHAVTLPALDYTNDVSSLTASIGYAITKDYSINVSGQYRVNRYSIPSTWTRGNYVPSSDPNYIDTLTQLYTQNTIDRFIDVSVIARPITELHLDLGFSLTSSSDGPFVTYAAMAFTSNGTATTTPAAAPDVNRYGGPYTQYMIHGAVSYDISQKIGIMADYEYVYYKEDTGVDHFVAVENYKGSLIRGGFSLKL